MHRTILWIGAALLLAASAASATQYRQLTFLDQGYDAGIGTPEWSPDGTRVAYTHWWIDPEHSYLLFGYVGIVRVQDGVVIPFESQWPPCTPDVPLGEPSWSPAGDRIVYSCASQLWIGWVAETLSTQVAGAIGGQPA